MNPTALGPLPSAHRPVPSLVRAVGPALLTAVLVAACGGGSDGGGEAAGSGGVAGEAVAAPLDTDIFLGTLTRSDGNLTATVERNVTARWGYDNQPHWLPDGSGFYYTAQDDDGTDIWRYDVESGIVAAVTVTEPESEYSATPIPNQAAFSAVRVEADSTQRLWRFPTDGSEPSVIFEDIAPVGYHAWLSPRVAALFVLGDPPTLQIADAGTGAAVVLDEDIGRSIQSLPGGGAVSFVKHLPTGRSTIMRTDEGGRTSSLATVLGDGDFHAWTPDGWLLMGEGSRLMGRAPDTPGGTWSVVVDLAPYGVDQVTRIAVSPDGERIAVVGEALADGN